MNYSRNMPDWQQYSTLQSGESERQQASATNASVAQQQQQQQQTVQPGAGSSGSSGSGAHLFNLDCLNKGQNEPAQQAAFYGRAPGSGSVVQQAAGSPLGQSHPSSHPAPPPGMVHHMAGCVGHGYGPGMAVMEDGRLTAAMGEDMQQQQQQHHHQQHQQQQQQQQQQQHRGVQMSMSSPTSRIPPGGMTVNGGMGGLGQMMPGPPHPASGMPAAGRQSSYSCKGACCQGAAAGLAYRWDKMNPYQSGNPYRETMHPPSGSYATMDGRSTRYSRTEMYRKESMTAAAGFPLDQQQLQQQQQQQRRYRKEPSQVSRSYHQPTATSALPPNYTSMQNYGFTPADYQKYYGGMKEYARGVGPTAAQSSAAGMIKYPDPSITMQDKYLSKQAQYQPPNGPIMQNGVMVSSPAGIATGMPSPYFSPQLARDLPSEFPCGGSESKDQDGRLGPAAMSLQSKHLYQQKLAMQRINLENHLREFTRIPGYQNHPKYQEYLMKYREAIRLQQSLEYQSSMQAGMGGPTAPTAPSMPPINLQFDQNGVLINSSLMPGYNPGMQPTMAGMPNPLSPKEPGANPYDSKAMQAMEHAMAQQQQQQQQLTSSAAGPHSMTQHSPETHYLAQRGLDDYHHPMHHHHPQQQQQQQLEDEAVANAEAQQQKPSKDFADKPELDVRQFLANWDETEEEDGMNGALQNVIVTDSTPIVVLEYENLNLAADNLTTQAICVSADKEAPSATTIALALPAQKSSDKDQIASANATSEAEGANDQTIPTTVNIIRCITSAGVGCDEVPTIHIVDTLENEAVVKKIEGAFHSLNSADIKSIEELVNKSSAGNAAGSKEERISLSFLNTAAILQPKEASDKTADQVNNAGAVSKSSADQSTVNQSKDAAAEKSSVSNDNNNTNSLNLSSTSFVNEDTRNHDDLSLPELPTSECTPISTTLNTPNHSDNEESSERVHVMSISTNSMEIMPSSPIISFAHSPIKFRKTSTSEELHFDFQNSNEASSASVLKETNVVMANVTGESNMKGSQESKTVTQPERETPVTSNVSQSQQHCNTVIDPAVFEFSEFSNSSSLQLGEEPKMPAPPMEGNCLTKIIKDTPPITALKVLDSDDDLVDKVNDMWMEISLDGSLSNNDNKVVASEEKQVQTDKLRKICKTGLRHFRKNKTGINPTKIIETPARVDTPKGLPVPSVEETVTNINKPTASAKPLEKERESRKSLDSALKNISTDKIRKRAKSVEFNRDSNQDQEKLLKEFKNLKRKRSIGQIQDEIAILKSSIDELRNLNNQNINNNNDNNNLNNNDNNNFNSNNVSNNINTSNNNDEINNTTNNSDTNINKNNDHNIPSSNNNPSSDINICKNASLPMLPDTKVTTNSRRRFSSIFDDPLESSLEKVPDEVSSKQCVDSDIKIQLSNVNLQIKDKKETNNSRLCSANSQKDGIKIEINVSRVESQRLHVSEVVSTSNQHLNISLPPTSPMSCKVDCRTSISTVEDDKETVTTLDNRALPEKEVVPEKLQTVEKEKEAKVITEETKEEENILTFGNKNVDEDTKDKCLILETNANNNKIELDINDVPLKKLDKKETDIENALKKLDECRRESIHEVKSENTVAISPDCFQNKSFVDTPAPGCSKDLDFDNFDVEPYDDKSDDYLKDLLLSSDSKEHYRSHNSKAVGYFNPLFHLDELENLNTVPVYTTKDGKITYSPNPNYTYRALIIEARQREGHLLFRDYYENKGGKKSKHCSSSKSQDSISKCDYGKKYSKSSHYKYKFDDKKDKYEEDNCMLSFENCLMNESLPLNLDKRIDVEEDRGLIKEEECGKMEEEISEVILSKFSRKHNVQSIVDDKSKNDNAEQDETAIMEENRLSRGPLTPSPVVLRNECVNNSLPLLEETREGTKKSLLPEKETDSKLKTVKKCIVDLQNLKEDILKKLNDQVSHCKSRVEEFESHVSRRVSVEKKEEECEKQPIQTEDENVVKVLKEVPCLKEKNDSKTEIECFENNDSKIDLENFENKNEAEVLGKLETDIDLKVDQSLLEESICELEVSHSVEISSIDSETKIVDNVTEDIEKSEIKSTELVEINTELVDEKIILESAKSVESESELSECAKSIESTKVGSEVPQSTETKEIKTDTTVPIESVESIEKITEIAEIVEPIEKISETTEIPETNEKVSEAAELVQVKENILEKTELIETKENISETTVSNSNEVKISDSSIVRETEIKIPETTEVIETERKSQELINNVTDLESENIEETRVILQQKEIKILEKEETVLKESDEKPTSLESSLKLTCSIDKSNFSSELCSRFINQEKLHTSQIDAIAKTVPKLVIRKSDTNPKFFSKSKSNGGNVENCKKEQPENTSPKSLVHPKIPKMIIRNARSRPTTPSIEEISETSCSSLTDNEPKSLKVKIKLEDKAEPVGQRLQNSCDSSEAKIPKMKIKLEEKLPRVVIENIDLSCMEQKIVPKMKITNVKGSLPKIMDKQTMIVEDDKSDTNSSFFDNDGYKVREKSSKTRSKRDSPNYSSSSESSQKRHSSSSSSQSKKAKRSPKEEVNLDPNLEDTQFLLENEYRQRNNSNSCSSNISTKIPKVIIKRTSPSAEFKCELSKEAIVNAQPQVVLKRSWMLDCMAKDMRHMKVVVKVAPTQEEIQQENKSETNEQQWERFISGLKKRRELSRSNSTSDLNRFSPPKIKRRRTSDYTIGTLDYSDSDSSTRFAFTKKTFDDEIGTVKSIRRASLNLASEVHPFSSTKTCWKSLDENMNSKSKMDFENDDRLDDVRPKLFNSSNKMETIIEASDSFSSESLYKLSIEKSNSSMIELEMLGDGHELLDKDVDVHEEEIDGTMDDFETNESSIIKVESSDESQTTIEILAASPDLSHELDAEHQKDIEEEQIYSEDAVPMHFQYELEIGAESPVDLLEVPIPGSETETDKTSSSIERKQIPGILIHEQLVIEDTSGNTSLNERMQSIIVDNPENSSLKLENSTSNSCPEDEQPILRLEDETSSTSTSLNNQLYPKNNGIGDNVNSSSNSHEIITTTDEENSKVSGAIAPCSYSDLLVKEVLAAKETLKKYLGNLSSGSGEISNSAAFGSSPKAEPERKQDTSFDMSRLAKYNKIVSNTSNFKHRDKRRRLIRGKSRSTEARSSSSSRNNTETSSSNRLESRKSLHRRNTESSKSSRDRNSKSSQIKSHKTARSSDARNDSLARAVEENLRHSKLREKAEDKAVAISDRETSRTPPVITNASNEVVVSNDLVDEVPKRVENVISRSDEASLNAKVKALQLSPEMTISNIVQELVFHDKATIRHRRYCMLCERWFPSAFRHRRHLAGYQHRHTELTQRRAIHMLFLFFTGKLCPKLLPPNVVRTDCIPGELTPLQIAVQDFAMFKGVPEATDKKSDDSKE